MSLSAIETDYIVEMFNIGLGSVGQEVTAIIEREVEIAAPKLTTLASMPSLDPKTVGAFAAIGLSGGFSGRAIFFLDQQSDRELASLVSISECKDENKQDEVIVELSQVVLDRYVVFMAELLDLNIQSDLVELHRGKLEVFDGFIEGAEPHSFALYMNFKIVNTQVRCHIIFINDSHQDNFLPSVKAALKELGVEEL